MVRKYGGSSLHSRSLYCVYAGTGAGTGGRCRYRWSVPVPTGPTDRYREDRYRCMYYP